MHNDDDLPRLQVRMKNKEKRVLVDWFTERQWPVFGSLLFNNFAHSSQARRFSLLKIYWSKLDRIYFGNNVARKGLRIQRHVVLHYGANGDNLHAHFLSEAVGDLGDYCKVSRRVWGDLSNETAGVESTKIEAVNDVAGCAAYLVHEFDGHYNYAPELSVVKDGRDLSSMALDQRAKHQVRKALYGCL